MKDMTPLENLAARVRFTDMPSRLREDLLEVLEELSDARNDLAAAAKVIEDLEVEAGRR